MFLSTVYALNSIGTVILPDLRLSVCFLC